MAKFEFVNINFSKLYEGRHEFRDMQQKIYPCKYAQNSKVKLGFHVEGDQKILKGLQYISYGNAKYLNSADQSWLTTIQFEAMIGSWYSNILLTSSVLDHEVL